MTEFEPLKVVGTEELKVEGSGAHEQNNFPYDLQTQESNNFTSLQSTAADTFRNEIQPRKFKKFESDFLYPETSHGGLV